MNDIEIVIHIRRGHRPRRIGGSLRYPPPNPPPCSPKVSNHPFFCVHLPHLLPALPTSASASFTLQKQVDEFCHSAGLRQAEAGGVAVKLYVHTHAHIYIYIYIYTCMHIHVHACEHTHTHIYIYTYIHIYAHVHMYKCR